MTLKLNSPGLQVPNMLLEKNGEITPEKNEETEPKQKQCPVVDVTGDEIKSSAVKSNNAQEPGMLGP